MEQRYTRRQKWGVIMRAAAALLFFGVVITTGVRQFISSYDTEAARASRWVVGSYECRMYDSRELTPPAWCRVDMDMWRVWFPAVGVALLTAICIVLLGVIAYGVSLFIRGDSPCRGCSCPRHKKAPAKDAAVLIAPMLVAIAALLVITTHFSSLR